MSDWYKMRVLIFLVSVALYVSRHGSSASPLIKCTKVVDIAMLLDESGSIGRRDFEKIKKFVGDVISRFSVTPFGAHFAAVKYSTSPRDMFSLTKYTSAEQLKTAVRNAKYLGGRTFTGKAMEWVKNKVFGTDEDRKDAPNVLVIFSDGAAHDHCKAIREAREMKKKGVVILCVGIGRGKNVKRLIKMLQQLAHKPEYVFNTTIDTLQTIEDSLVKEMCEIISACISGPCKNGGQCVDEGKGRYECKCTPNWEGKNCELPKWCPEASFTKWGCYRTPRPRKATLLFNRRNSIDWNDGWDKFLDTIVCDCGAAAKKGGYRYFCIEFYGECWGYKQFDVSLPHAGATQCWGKRPNYNTCIHDQKNPICVGTANHGYIYELQQQVKSTPAKR